MDSDRTQDEVSMETILEIKEIDIPGTWSGESGFEIVTDKQSIKMLIGNGQDCCEVWGYFFCNDDPQQFVGAKLHDVKLTDTALNEAQMKANDLDPNGKYFEGGVMFVNLETNKGTLQFVVYNCHNGYYGHKARVQSRQLTEETTL